MSVITFPRRKRPRKALVVTKIDENWYTVVILPQGPRDAEMFGVYGDGGADFADYRSAIADAIDTWEAIGRDAGLLLIDDARLGAEGGAK